METIVLRDDLRQTLEIKAKEKNKSINDIVNEAIEHYLEQQQQAKLENEIAAYEKLYPELHQTYFTEWVAINNQKLVDHDKDRAALCQRIRAKYGSMPVLIRQVTHQVHNDIWLRTPSTGRIS